MDHEEDDVQRLFSWLQTPDLRYREFAGAREVTDTVITLRPRANTASAGVPPARPLADEERSEPTAPAAPTPASGSGLLGGAYRDVSATEADPAPSAAPQPAPTPPDASPSGGRALDSIFGRLAGTRERLPDPRERPRQGPGSGSSGGRSR